MCIGGSGIGLPLAQPNWYHKVFMAITHRARTSIGRNHCGGGGAAVINLSHSAHKRANLLRQVYFILWFALLFSLSQNTCNETHCRSIYFILLPIFQICPNAHLYSSQIGYIFLVWYLVPTHLTCRGLFLQAIALFNT